MLEELKYTVWQANQRLKKEGLVILSWGNVSQIDRERGLVVIKPSGLSYDTMQPEDMVVVDLDGKIVEGKWSPSSDTPTHVALYRAFPSIGGITHTHSRWATVFAQCGRGILPLGTTHADSFYGEIPCTARMTAAQISKDYEKNTAVVIAECFTQKSVSEVPGVLVHSHGPFTWGKDAKASVENAMILEEVAMMAWHTQMMTPKASLQQELLDKHFLRKHGENAYYGQKAGQNGEKA